jgi:hypothetical protein
VRRRHADGGEPERRQGFGGFEGVTSILVEVVCGHLHCEWMVITKYLSDTYTLEHIPTLHRVHKLELVKACPLETSFPHASAVKGAEPMSSLGSFCCVACASLPFWPFFVFVCGLSGITSTCTILDAPSLGLFRFCPVVLLPIEHTMLGVSLIEGYTCSRNVFKHA